MKCNLSTESRDDNSVYDLFELVQVHKKNHGVSLVKGEDPYSPAYKILNPDLIPPVPETPFRDLVDSVHAERGFLLLANFKQFKRTRGSILTFEKRDGSGPIFEIISNGKANTLDVVYSTENKQQVVSIEEADLATGHWKNITLFVQEERAQLYVGCEEINTAELDLPISRILTQDVPASARLRIGKGAVKDRFMVSGFIFIVEEWNGSNALGQCTDFPVMRPIKYILTTRNITQHVIMATEGAERCVGGTIIYVGYRVLCMQVLKSG